MAESKKIIDLGITFQVTSVRNEEYRDPKAGLESSYSTSLIDVKQLPRKENDWSPTSNISICIMNKGKLNIEYGKKYKVTLTEV